MKHCILALLACSILTGSALAADPPSVELHNKQLRLKVYTPDAKAGFYQGTRFDWSGVIGDLEFAGHHLYRPWFNAVDPSVRDFTYTDTGITASANSAMVGPAEEFQKPIGYDTAKAGDTFLKVGVGILRKSDDAAYFFGKHFDLVDGGTWTTRSTANSVTFQQMLGKPGQDYAYLYTKTIRLVGSEAKLTIEHSLKNLGKVPIVTPLYDHNFLTIDGLNVGRAYTILAPYEIKPTRAPDPKFAGVEGHTASYHTDLQGQDRAAFGLQGFSSQVSDYDFQVKNASAHLAVRMQGDRPLSNASVWSIRSVLAVEPFIDVSAQPGEEFRWSYTYTYSTLEAQP
ncbi:MAG TPA: hypothetical protein VGC07_01320 [Granulicella sp.]